MLIFSSSTAKQFVFRSAELDGDTMGETEQQMRYRLDDNEDWAQPDIGDYGLPNAMASLLASWYIGNVGVAINWADNIAHFLFLPECWNFRISFSSIEANIEAIARECHKALKVAGTDYDEKADENAYDMACVNIARLVALGASTADISTAGSTQLDKRCGAEPDDMDARHAALSLSYYWLGNLHEKNKRFSPAFCYKQSKREARTIAIEGNDYIERIIDFLPVP